MKRVLITGADGLIGTVLRERLADRYDLRFLTWQPVAGLDSHVGDIADLDAIAPAFEGIDAVVQLAGHATMDATWEQALHSNIIGIRNVFEAAARAGVERVVYASSNHAVGQFETDGLPGIYRPGQTEFPMVDHHVPWRPDSYYGVSKAFGEALGALYAEKHGMGVLAIRIGNFGDRPLDRRRLSIWISPRDFLQLVRIGLEHPEIRYEVVYGASESDRSWWDNANAYRLGYRPEDESEPFAAEILANEPEPTDLVAERFQGGPFCSAEFTGDIERAS